MQAIPLEASLWQVGGQSGLHNALERRCAIKENAFKSDFSGIPWQAGGRDSVLLLLRPVYDPGWGTKILQATPHSQKISKQKLKK